MQGEALAAKLIRCHPRQRGDDWGTLTGRFVYDGKPPKAKPITADKDPEYCGKHNLVDESLTAGSDGGVANMAVE